MNPTFIALLRLVLLLGGALGGFVILKTYFHDYPQARQEAAEAAERNATLSAAYTALGASVRDLSQKQRQTEESYDEIRRQAAARGKVDGCGLCAPVRDDLDRLRRAEAGRLHPAPGQ